MPGGWRAAAKGGVECWPRFNVAYLEYFRQSGVVGTVASFTLPSTKSLLR